jgi:Polyketide cyclase / dehydrase and lipid transport
VWVRQRRWEFAPGPTPTSCWLSFSVDFAFKSPLYGQLATVFFKEVLLHVERASGCRVNCIVGTLAAAVFFRVSDMGCCHDMQVVQQMMGAFEGQCKRQFG